MYFLRNELSVTSILLWHRLTLKLTTMKKQMTLMFLVSLMILFVACDPTNNNNGDITNYWTTNALVRLQLKGSVKTITQNEVITEFNSQGQII